MGPLACQGIGEVAIRNLVTAFYLRVRHDPILAPVFERAIGKNAFEDMLRENGQEIQ